MPKGEAVTNPLIEPYLTLLLNHREAIRRQVAQLTDEEMDQVLVLFHHRNLRDIPAEFWTVAPAVRLAIKAEKQRRINQSSLAGTNA